MPLRSSRALTSIAVAGLVVLVVMVVSTASSSGAFASGRADRGLMTRCLKAVLGIGGGSATPVAGSADPRLVSSLAVFRRTRSAADTLPVAARLRQELAGAGATTYDPSAAVLLKRGTGAHGAVYGVPATIAVPALPAGCGGLPQFAGVGGYLALQADEAGSGPGACLVSTQLVEGQPSGVYLPGAASSKPTKTLTATGVVCKSEAVLSGYVGALGDDRLGAEPALTLIPDGITAITYTLADGRRFTVPVAGNLATPPAALSVPPSPHPVTPAELGRQLAAHLPTTMTESGAGAYPIATLARPGSLIADAVASFSFLRRLLTSSTVSGSSSSDTSGTGASCSARTHRCVAVTVTTTCDSHERCRTSRTIHRYRYVTAKPPPGTTGPDTQPTAPIVGRVNRFITRPRKLTLVLSGAPHRHVVVLLSVSCFGRNSAASVGGPPPQVAVPSRTPIALPGPARTFSACDVGALVLSSQHGPVHVTVARG